jgi:hypothetical protein
VNGTPIGTMIVRDTEYEVRVTGGGLFFADLSGHPVESPTYDGLAAKLDKATRKQAVKIELRVCKVDGESGARALSNPQEVIRGTITGIHGANGNLLISWDSGRKEQADKYMTLLPDLSTGQEHELNTLLRKAWEARRSLDQYQARLPKLDARREAERLVREAEFNAGGPKEQA